MQEGKWLGASPAGMKPGDLLTTLDARGHEIKMNLRDTVGKQPCSQRRRALYARELMERALVSFLGRNL